MAMEWLRRAAAERAAKWLQSAQERQRELQERLEAKEGQKEGQKSGGAESKPEAQGLKSSALAGAEVSAGELWRLYRSARGTDSARRETLNLLAARAGERPQGPKA